MFNGTHLFHLIWAQLCQWTNPNHAKKTMLFYSIQPSIYFVIKMWENKCLCFPGRNSEVVNHPTACCIENNVRAVLQLTHYLGWLLPSRPALAMFLTTTWQITWMSRMKRKIERAGYKREYLVTANSLHHTENAEFFFKLCGQLCQFMHLWSAKCTEVMQQYLLTPFIAKHSFLLFLNILSNPYTCHERDELFLNGCRDWHNWNLL